MNVEVRPIKTAAETALAASFAMAKRALPGAAAVAALREEAFRRFETEGLPHRRVEEWKYTDLRALMRDAKPLAGVPDAAAKARAGGAGAMLDRGAAHRIRGRRFRAGTFRPCRTRCGPHRPLDGGRCWRPAIRSSLRIWARWCRPTTSRSRSTPPSWATAW